MHKAGKIMRRAIEIGKNSHLLKSFAWKVWENDEILFPATWENGWRAGGKFAERQKTHTFMEKKAVRCEFLYAQSWNFIWSGRGRKPGDRKKSAKTHTFWEVSPERCEKMKKKYSLRPQKMAGGQAESPQRDRKLTPLWKKGRKVWVFFMHKAGKTMGRAIEIGKNSHLLRSFAWKVWVFA